MPWDSSVIHAETMSSIHDDSRWKGGISFLLVYQNVWEFFIIFLKEASYILDSYSDYGLYGAQKYDYYDDYYNYGNDYRYDYNYRDYEPTKLGLRNRGNGDRFNYRYYNKPSVGRHEKVRFLSFLSIRVYQMMRILYQPLTYSVAQKKWKKVEYFCMC